MGDIRYFAYGSNMLRERLVSRCAGARLLGRASLPGHRLVFEKRSVDGSAKCAYERSVGDALEGVVWSIPDEALNALDRLEGRGSGYEREQIEVRMEQAGEPVSAMTYRATELVADRQPYDWYLALVRAGADQQGLTPELRNWLATVDATSDPNPERESRQDALAALRTAGYGKWADAIEG